VRIELRCSHTNIDLSKEFCTYDVELCFIVLDINSLYTSIDLIYYPKISLHSKFIVMIN